MDLKYAVSIIGNFTLIAGLAIAGFHFFAEYHATGKWAKNVTGLLAGLGLLTLAFALLITPANAEVIAQIALTKANVVFLGISSAWRRAAGGAGGGGAGAGPRRRRRRRRI